MRENRDCEGVYYMRKNVWEACVYSCAICAAYGFTADDCVMLCVQQICFLYVYNYIVC